MTDQTPQHALSAAADAIRAFNHTSRSPQPGWEFPGASYDALGTLSTLASRLPQALEQSVRPVMRTYEHGRVQIDGGGDPDAAVRYLQEVLGKALAAATTLTEAVSQMHAATSAMGLDTEGIPEFEDDGLDEGHREGEGYRAEPGNDRGLY